MMKWKKGFVVVLVCIGISSLFSIPLVSRLSAEGIWDWPEAAATYESFRHSVLHYRQFLFWNPYICGGAPGLANPQTYFFSLAGLISLLTNAVIGPKIAVWLSIIIGGIGMVLFGRALAIPYPAVFLAVPLFFTSGFLATHLALGQFLWLTTMWVPWIFWGYIKSFKKIEYIFVSVLALAFIGIAGRSYLLAYVGIGLLLYALILDVASNGKKRALIRVVFIGAGAFLIGAFKFLPDLFFFREKIGALEDTMQLPISYIADMFLSRPINVVETSPENIAGGDFAYYIGIIPVMLAGSAFLYRSVRRVLAPLIFVGIVFFAIGLSALGANPLELLPYIKELRNQHRVFIMVLFVISLLAAAGLSRITRFIPFAKTRTMRHAIQVGIILFVLVDLFITTKPLLLQGYPHLPDTSRQDIPFIDSSFVQARGNNPYRTVKQNRGAATFCPAILYAWQDVDSVTIIQDADYYRGEVYVDGDGQAEITKFSPNILHLKANVASGDIIINYKHHEGWESSAGEVFQADNGLLAIKISPGDYDIVLAYHAPGFPAGLGLTIAALAGIVTFMWVKSNTRVKMEIHSPTKKESG